MSSSVFQSETGQEKNSLPLDFIKGEIGVNQSKEERDVPILYGAIEKMKVLKIGRGAEAAAWEGEEDEEDVEDDKENGEKENKNINSRTTPLAYTEVSPNQRQKDFRKDPQPLSF